MGKYGLFGNASCSNCNPGTFANVTGLSSCYLCPPGYSSIAGSSSCFPCPEGTFNTIDGSSTCFPCPGL